MSEFEQWYEQEIGSENKPEYEAAKWAWDFQQAKIEELQARVDELEKHLAIVLDEYYMEGRFSTKICNEAEKVLNKDDRLNDSWYVKHVKPYSE